MMGALRKEMKQTAQVRERRGAARHLAGAWSGGPTGALATGWICDNRFG